MARSRFDSVSSSGAQFITLQVFILIFIAVLHTGSADEYEYLLKEIAKTENETLKTLKDVEDVNSGIGIVGQQILKFNELLYNQTSKLKEHQRAIISKMYELSANASQAESAIEYFENRLLNEKQKGYRLKFIIRLFTEDLGLLLKLRKSNGEEKACFEFAKNKTTLGKSSVREIQVDVASSMGPKERNITILKRELKRAQWDLEVAKGDLALAKGEYHAAIEHLKRTKYLGRKEIDDLINNINTDKETEKTLENDLKRKINKLNGIRSELKTVLFHNFILNKNGLKLKAEHDKFKKAIECYEHLEKTF